MKKITILFFLALLTAIILGAETIANVTSQKGLALTIDRGAADGVAIGMKGIVKAVYKEPGGEYTINIGIFTVRKVSERSAEVAIEIGKGLNPADARYVVFENDLVPRENKAELVAPGTGNADWHLEQGDKAADAKKFKTALEHYQKALEIEPGHLVAKEKYNEMKKVIATNERSVKFKDYLKKADANYEKNNVKFAFLYLVEALRLYPEGKDDVRNRLAVMDREYPMELATILNEKSDELKDIRPQIDLLLTKAGEPEQIPVKSRVEKAEFTESYLKKIAPKAEKIVRNGQGYWEAVFVDDIIMVYIPEGEFTIGSPSRDGGADEHPSHKVFVHGFWIGKNEVTFAQYDRFCMESGRKKAGDEGWGRENRPAIYVSWNDARDFCLWLEQKTGLKFRLPSEAEWEKTARDRFPWGNAAPDSNRANFNKNHMMTRPVGSYPKGASPYGVLDMAGNVWEWIADWYDADFYRNSPRDNPQGPETGLERVVRGGSWSNSADLVRSANRSHEKPENKLNILGFRLALDGD